MMYTNYDVAIVGLGAVGSAALYQLTKLGLTVIGIDSYSPPHIFGSSGGETRIVRQAIGEGEHYVPLALQSYDIWQELEQLSQQKLLYKVGGLVLAPREDKFFGTTVQAAQKYNIKHKIFDNQEIKKKFPELKVNNNILGYYEYDAGYVKPEKCIDVQIQLARQKGGVLKFNEKVVSINSSGPEIIIKTNKEQYRAKKIIISAGSWINEFISSEYRQLFTVYRQVLYWFDILTKNYFDPLRFPIFIWQLPDKKGGIYGFPAVDGPFGGVKIATHNMITSTRPDELNRVVSKLEINNFYERFVKKYLPDLGPTCLKTAVCTYTTTRDENFIVDYSPNNNNILIVSACSGHGFKHSAAVGRIAAQSISGTGDLAAYSCFSLARFRTG